jgi:hypothetical protein
LKSKLFGGGPVAVVVICHETTSIPEAELNTPQVGVALFGIGKQSSNLVAIELFQRLH